MQKIRPCAHGTRARYTQGCRCDACREANRLSHQERDRARKASVQAALANVAPAPGNRCPGVFGDACPTNTKLYKNSGPVCERCRNRFAYDGVVDATVARAHLLTLKRLGVGVRRVQQVTGLGRSLLTNVRLGRQLRIRAGHVRKILAVDSSHRAQRTILAWESYRLLDELIAAGYPAARLAKLLGYKSAALQFRTPTITTKNALRIRILHWQLSRPTVVVN